MALSTVTVTFDLAQILGTDYDPRRTKVRVYTNVANQTLIDTAANKIRMGDETVTLASDGTGSFTTWAPGPDGNPTTWQTYVAVAYPQAGLNLRKTRVFGPYTITANADLADLEEEQAVPPEYLTTVTTLLDARVIEAEGFRDEAEGFATDVEANINGLDVGTVTTAPPGTPADVVLSGTAPDRTFDFTIPTGPQGLPGPGSAAWTSSTAVTTGAIRQAPDGSYIKSTANRTTRASFDATEEGFWTAVLADPTSVDGKALSASYVAEGSAFADIGKQPGVDPTGVTECAAPIQTALDAFLAFGVRAYAKGTFKIGSTVAIKGNADLGDATFNWVGTGAGVAVQVGPGGSGVILSRAYISLPRVVNTKKTTTGWAQSGVTGTTGVKCINLDACSVTVPFIQDFETGLHLYGQGQGTSYTTIHLGHLDTNKVQNLMSADATGWCNENKIRGGKMSYNSSEGASVSGTRNIHIPVTTNLVNNNVWDAVSLEGDTPEFHVECGGLDNEWRTCRWENGLTGCRVKWIDPAHGNQILRGNNAERIVTTLGASALPQNILSNYRWDFGCQMPGTAATTTDYSVRVNSQGVRVKPYSGSIDRIFLESSTGKVWLGEGSVLNCSFGALGTAGIALYAGNLYSGTDATYDIGLSSSYRFRDLNLSRDANIGRNAKALAFVDTQVTPTFAAGQNISFASGALAVLTMTGNITSLGFLGGTAGGLYEVHFVQDATGSRTITGAAASIKWAGGAPTLTTTPGKRDIFRFRYDGTNWYEATRSMNVG